MQDNADRCLDSQRQRQEGEAPIAWKGFGSQCAVPGLEPHNRSHSWRCWSWSPVRTTRVAAKAASRERLGEAESQGQPGKPRGGVAPARLAVAEVNLRSSNCPSGSRASRGHRDDVTRRTKCVRRSRPGSTGWKNSAGIRSGGSWQFIAFRSRARRGVVELLHLLVTAAAAVNSSQDWKAAATPRGIAQRGTLFGELVARERCQISPSRNH